jgi:hypothetical protein
MPLDSSDFPPKSATLRRSHANFGVSPGVLGVGKNPSYVSRLDARFDRFKLDMGSQALDWRDRNWSRSLQVAAWIRPTFAAKRYGPR